MMKKILLIFLILFTNESNSFNIKKNRISVLIGDSNVGVISNTKGYNQTNIKTGLYKVGISTIDLISMLGKLNPDTTYNTVFVAIGTNDLYKTDNSIKLKKTIQNAFPRVKEIYVIWGSRGWGNVSLIDVKQQDIFYSKFEKNGYKVIKCTKGYFKNSYLAHTPNQPYQNYIIKQFILINLIYI
jgi:hypothetical protein